MTRWTCGIRDCGAEFDDAEDVVVHQVTDHDSHTCKVCDTVVPEGYFAIRHALDSHSRADYVRAYDADAAAIREREEILTALEHAVDTDRLRDELGVLDGDAPEE